MVGDFKPWVNRRMRKQVKGGDTRGRPVGGKVVGGGVLREWKGALISTESTTKPPLFTLKRKEIFFFP